MNRAEFEQNVTRPKAYPVDDYELEIENVENLTFTKKDGSTGNKCRLFTTIVSPESLSSRKFTTSLFYDKQFLRIVEAVTGKSEKESIDMIFDGPGPDAKIDLGKVKGALRGQFIKVRLGIDGAGYNSIAKVYEKTQEEPV